LQLFWDIHTLGSEVKFTLEHAVEVQGGGGVEV
jgi:hypothetical protein